METEFSYRFSLRPRYSHPDSVDNPESGRKVEWIGRHDVTGYGTVGNICCRALDAAPASLTGPVSRRVQ